MCVRPCCPLFACSAQSDPCTMTLLSTVAFNARRQDSNKTSCRQAVSGAPVDVAFATLLVYAMGLACEVLDLTAEELLNGEVTMPQKQWSQICQPAKQMVRGLLTTSGSDRLTLEEALQSSFLSGQASTTPIKGLPSCLEEVRGLIQHNDMHYTSNFRPSTNVCQRSKIANKEAGSKLRFTAPQLH